MKKTMIALALASAMGVSHAGVTVFGSVEQRLTNVDNGTTSSWDLQSDDQFVGFRAAEDLGNGMSAFAEVSMDIDSEAANGATTRDTFVGIAGGFGSVTAGRQTSVNDKADDATVDIFEGSTLGAKKSDRVSNTVAYTTPNISGLTGTVSVEMNGASGQDTQDVVDYGVSYANGPVTVVAAYHDDKNNNDQVTTLGGSVALGDLTVGGLFQTEENNDGTVDTDTKSVVASYALGNNVVKAGYQTGDEINDVTIVELQHNFTKNANAYVNYKKDSPAAGVDTDTVMVGMRVNF